MTTEELPALVYAEQGYLVVGSHHPLELGATYGPTRSEQMQHPFIPVAISNERSWEQQNDLIERVYGRRMEGRYLYYYCVEGVAD